MKARLLRVFLFGAVLLTLLTACSAGSQASLSVESVWGRPSMMYPTAGAMYMVIKNGGEAADTLLSGSSPACGSIEVHKTVMKADGTMGMELVDKPLEIAPGGEVKLEPGGLHIMCIQKTDKFVPGTNVDLTLKFEKSGEKTVSVELRNE